MRGLVLAAALLAGGDAAAAQSVQISVGEDTVQASKALLRGLDTLNGTAQDIPVEIGEVVRYGHLEIIVDTCRVPVADTSADAFAFLRIRDIREETDRFSGWMFASSPALSALDHQRYDVWVLSCSNS